jgi:hypothetical protein
VVDDVFRLGVIDDRRSVTSPLTALSGISLDSTTGAPLGSVSLIASPPTAETMGVPRKHVNELCSARQGRDNWPWHGRELRVPLRTAFLRKH